MPKVAAPDADMQSAFYALASQLAAQNAAATGTPVGMVAGGAGAGVLALAIIGALIYVVRRNRKARKQRQTNAPVTERAPVASPQTSGDTTDTDQPETE
jgi:flagellar biogenesis protein FliO